MHARPYTTCYVYLSIVRGLTSFPLALRVSLRGFGLLGVENQELQLLDLTSAADEETDAIKGRGTKN